MRAIRDFFTSWAHRVFFVFALKIQKLKSIQSHTESYIDLDKYAAKSRSRSRSSHSSNGL